MKDCLKEEAKVRQISKNAVLNCLLKKQVSVVEIKYRGERYVVSSCGTLHLSTPNLVKRAQIRWLESCDDLYFNLFREMEKSLYNDPGLKDMVNQWGKKQGVLK